MTSSSELAAGAGVCAAAPASATPASAAATAARPNEMNHGLRSRSANFVAGKEPEKTTTPSASEHETGEGGALSRDSTGPSNATRYLHHLG